MRSPDLHDPLILLQARVAKLEAALKLTATSVTVAMGESQIVLTKTSIDLKARDISLTTTGRTTVKAGGDLVMKGARILQN